MDKQVARYVHRQNLDTTEIWDGGVLPVIFTSLIFGDGVYYTRKLTMER